jgi:RNase H-like domain found in reverse transcriptase
LQCDATQTTVAGILNQLDDQGQERVVAYASRKLLARERNYPTIQRELLAICWCLEHWDQYVYGKHVEVFLATDL